TLRYPSRFILIASMNPEEEDISSHFLDRFGMCVIWEGLKDRLQRIEIIKKVAFPEAVKSENLLFLDKSLKEKISSSKQFLENIKIPESVNEYISQLCLENGVSGHRGELYLRFAARALAAFDGDQVVSKEDVDKVSALVLTHRKRLLEQMEQRKDHPNPDETLSDKEKEKGNLKDPERTNKDFSPRRFDIREAGDGKDSNHRQLESSPREEVFEIGTPFKIKRIVFKKDRIYRSSSGRRTKTRVKDRGGRYVRSIFRGRDDIALDATIRACAPYQRMRGRRDILLIQKEDLRFKQRERRMGHLVIFVLDGSGSMGAKRRMIETKGAILSLLIDSYQRREKVSMVVFRKERAEVVLPPTRSVEFALKRLKEMPVGGKTPLTAGLLESYKLIQRERMKSPETRFLLILITDGRANQTVTDLPLRDEIKGMVRLFKNLSFIDLIVIDTEDKKGFLRTDFALQIALELGAEYYTVDNIKSEFLTELVQDKIST
ncbi:MAG: VWA domain-containing protein, partial [Thermodesulfobacteriota bacterium]